MSDTESLRKTINKEMGEDALHFGSSSQFMPRYLSTGLPSLDDALNGGLRKGSLVLLTGEFSSGKTLLSQYFIKEAQAAGLETAYIDAERAFHQAWMTQSGVDCEKLLVSQISRGETVFNLVHSLIRHKFGLVVIDSLAALVSQAQADATMEQKFVGEKARMINAAVEKILVTMDSSRSDTIVVAINQYREVIGGGLGSPSQTLPGGKGQSFYAHLWLKVRRAQWETVKSKNKSQKYPQKIGYTMNVEVFKSKQSVPFQNVRIPVSFANQFDELASVVFEALDYSIIPSHGSYYDLDGQRFQGRAKLLDYVRENPEALERLTVALKGRTQTAEEKENAGN